MSAVSLERVSVRVDRPDGDGERTLLAELDLRLAERRIAVVGANGSGKSTFLRLLNGLVSPAEGRVLVNGIDVAAKTREVRKLVGFVFTDPLSQLVMSTPVEDIELSLRRRYRSRAERRERAVRLLEERGLGRVAHQSIYELSGGERQLVSLTTVLAVEPEIVVADEPTTLLDLRNRSQLVRAFTAMPQQLIYSTHDLDFAAQAERLLVFEAGRVVFDGEPAAGLRHYRELMERPEPAR